MAVRSRPSLRFSVRRDQETTLPPPAKRPRLQQQHHQQHPSHPSSSSSPSRRKSSPDLLESTIETENNNRNHSHHKPRHLPARHAHSPLPTPRPSTRRPLLSSPHPDSPRLKGIQTPSSIFATPYDDRSSRESPDPLDTISPALPKTRPLQPPPPPQLQPHNTSGSSPSASTRSTRHQRLGAEKANPTGSADKTAASRTPAQKNRSVEAVSAPSTSSPKRERRSLRSHDGGSRARSELASYFQNYEQLLSLEPPKTEVLTGRTTIKLINDLAAPPSISHTDTPFGNPLVHLHNCEVVELPSPPEQVEVEDPLDEAFYFRAHRRIERQEKQLRNIERERAQHEKLQLDRLLDELRSQDWLRVMGINGITDPEEKKLYEPKRDFFIKEISSIIDKFKIWKEEEKRRKLEKEKASFRSDASPTEVTPGNEAENEDDDTQLNGAVSDAQSVGEPPDINDVDALAARQLHQEARSATAGKRPKTYSSASRRKSKANTNTETQKPPPPPSSPPTPPPKSPQSQQQAPLPPPPPDRPFTSFYTDPQARETALSSQNRQSDTRIAFGHPIPDMEEQEFALPPELLTPEMIRACQRKRRKMKRESRNG